MIDLFNTASEDHLCDIEIEEEKDDVYHQLTQVGLIEENTNFDFPIYGLTFEGFQMAHHLKTERQRRLTNILLSSGIIIVSLLTFTAQYFAI